MGGGVAQYLIEILLLLAHMLAHLTAVVGIVFAENLAALAGFLGDMVEVVLQVGQALLKVVAVGGTKMLGDQTVVDAGHLLVVGAIVVESVDIANREKKMVVDATVATHLLDALLAESQRYSKPWQHKDQVVVGRNHFRHLQSAVKKGTIHAAKVRKKNDINIFFCIFAL